MKNQKGFAPVIIIVAVVVIAAGAIGYSVMNKGKLPGNGISLDANCKLGDPDLCKIMNKTSKGDFFQTGFSGKTTTTDKTGKKTESEFRIEKEGRSEFISKENGKETFRMINLDNTTYTKDLTDGKWIKMTFSSPTGTEKSSGFNTVDMKKQMQESFKDLEDKTLYTKIGKEACGTLQCFKYQVKNPILPDTIQYMYFDDREYLMRKMTTLDKDGNKTEMLFDYTPFTIQVPSPIKESPLDKINSSGTGKTGPSDTVTQEEVNKLLEKYKDTITNTPEEPVQNENAGE